MFSLMMFDLKIQPRAYYKDAWRWKKHNKSYKTFTKVIVEITPEAGTCHSKYYEWATTGQHSDRTH